jgi:hypothetical protein
VVVHFARNFNCSSKYGSGRNKQRKAGFQVPASLVLSSAIISSAQKSDDIGPDHFGLQECLLCKSMRRKTSKTVADTLFDFHLRVNRPSGWVNEMGNRSPID